MKILKLFVFAVAIFTLSACSSDDDAVAAVELNSANLTGTYEMTFLSGSSETSVTTSGVSVVVETESYSGDTFTNAILNLNADGTYSFSGSYRETSTTTITGQAPSTFSEIVHFDTTSGTYTFNNTSRTFTLDGDIVLDVTLFDGVNFYVTESYTESFDSTTEIGEEVRRFKKID